MPPPDGERPGPFALGDAERLRALLDDAGFAEIEIDALDLEQRHASFDGFWETLLDISRELPRRRARPPGVRDRRDPRRAGSAPGGFTAPDGSLAIPGRSLVAAADA